MITVEGKALSIGVDYLIRWLGTEQHLVVCLERWQVVCEYNVCVFACEYDRHDWILRVCICLWLRGLRSSSAARDECHGSKDS